MQCTSVLRATAALVSLSVLTVAAGAQNLPTIPPGLDTRAATNDPVLQPAVANHSIALVGISTEMIFVPAGRLVQDRDAGTAVLTGRVVDSGDPNKILDVNVTFTGLTAIPPSGSPKKELEDSAYVENGGPVNTSTFYYYTSFSGTLTGAGDWAGGVLTLTPRGPAMQVGDGANNKNALYGFSAWFDYWAISSPSGESWDDNVGDFNVNLLGDCLCAEASPPDAGYSSDGDTGAVSADGAFGCDTQWDLTTEAIFDIDIAAGTVRIVGEMVAQNDPNCGFCFDLTLSGRVDPGDPTYPPAGSPFTANILPVGLFANGGPIDPDHWVYYQSISGTLVGKNDLAGAQVTVSEQAGGPAGQHGAGVARNVEAGFYAPLRFDVDSQPTSGPLLTSANAEISLQLGQCTRPVLMPEGTGPIPQLPTVTNGCYEIRGCSLDTITSVQFGPHTITSQDPCDFGKGYFEIHDANSLTFCPPLCLDPGILGFHTQDYNGATSDAISLELVEPSQLTLACAEELQVGCEQSVWVWGGPTGPLRTCLVISGSNVPSVFSNRVATLLSLGIGNNFTNLVMIDGVNTNCYEQLVGTVPAAMAGLTLYFQVVTYTLPLTTFPLPTTNVCSTDYK